MKSTAISKRTFIITVAILSCIIIAVGVLAIVSFVGNKNNVPKDYDMSGITFKDSTVEYDGNEHTLEIIGTLPHGVLVEYTPNKLTEVGTLEVTASFTGAEMYNPIPSKTATLTITKATYDMGGVTFGNATLPYDGLEHVLEVNGNLPEGVSVSYTPNILTEIDSVEVTASFIGDNKNYNPISDMTATLTIVKATHDMSGITFSSATRPYDGLEHMLVIDGQLPEGVSVSYSPNTLTEIGFVEVTATFTYDSEHYNTIPNKTATLTIVKATHDMSGVAFEDKTVSYDGNEHTLEISGTLPEGVSVEYTNNTLTEIGNIQVTASFTYDKVHYNEIPDRTATLTVDGDGKYHKVTFVIDEDNSQSVIVEHGSSVKDTPEIPQVTGYDGEWDKPLTGITEDLTVNINYIPKQYTVTYIPNGGYIKERTQTVTYGEPFTLHEATRVGHTPHYMVDGEEIDSGIWKTDENITVSLDWEANKYKMTYVFDGATVLEDYATYGTEYTVPEYVLETCEAEKWISGDNSYVPKNKFNVTFTADKTLTAYIVHFANDYKVSVTEGTATITSYTGSEIDVVIPDRVQVDGQNYDVTAIAKNVFYQNTTMQSLLIPSGITSIGECAFGSCSNLETVYWNAENCASMAGYHSPIFQYCAKLAQIVIGENVKTIPSRAFDSMSYDGLKKVIWNATACTKAGDNHDNIYGYSYLIFGNSSSLTEVIIGDNVTIIPAYAFGSCEKLTSITIPNNVTSIGKYAFYECSGLTSVTIGNGVMSIGECAFAYCNSLEQITVESGNTKYHSDGNCLIETENNTLILGCKNSIIPNRVTSIGESAFHGCSGLTSITIPDSVTSIGESAFYGCSGLTSVTFSNAEGWEVSTDSNFSSSVRRLNSSLLADTTTAAEYLRSTYRSRYWRRVDE